MYLVAAVVSTRMNSPENTRSRASLWCHLPMGLPLTSICIAAQTEYIWCHMQFLIAGVHFNHCAISLPKRADWGPADSQPVGLFQDDPIRHALAPTFWTVGFLFVAPLVESLNGQDHKYCPWFAMKSGAMGCPPPGRSTIMEMWSWLTELSRRSFPFCHHQFRVISTLAWS